MYIDKIEEYYALYLKYSHIEIKLHLKWRNIREHLREYLKKKKMDWHKCFIDNPMFLISKI